MSLQVCIYEDDKYTQFYPLTHLRPVFTLRAGIVPLYQRLGRHQNLSSLSMIMRHQVAPLMAEILRDIPINIIKRPAERADLLFVNGRLRDFGDLFDMVETARLSTVYRNGDETVALLLKAETIEDAPAIATQAEYLELIETRKEEIADFDTTATLYHYLWDVMADIEPEIVADFEHVVPTLAKSAKPETDTGAHLVDRDKIYFGQGVKLMPGCVIDASHGPVFIGANTRVESHASVYGPAYIGPNCVVVAGKIVASSIGHTCRVGGEVEESVFQSYVNKYHAGFIGHSYVGSWVNFGAMTTNSDLKNNYSPIRCTVNGEGIDTGSIKVGSFVGDHTKFGIGTLLNTGITIGVCCNLFGGTLIADKEIESFRWGSSAPFDTYLFDKAIDTARKTADRRNQTLSEREVLILKAVFDGQDKADGVFSV